MISFIKDYVLLITTVTLIGFLAECILPEGNIKKYANFAISVILSICLASPLIKLENSAISYRPEIQNIQIDMSTAVKSTVQSTAGFENSDVRLTYENSRIKEIYIYTNNEKLLENAVEGATEEFLKSMLSAIYSVEKNNIYITG